ncbi:mycofactocin biosynthesis peptidyl-dipeptidase MftE [Microbacterium sp. GXF7504]
MHDAHDPSADLLAARTWQEVGDDVLLVPVGSTEQHGPHLPLSTDADVATAVARELARRHRAHGLGTAHVAPTLAYGASGEHQGFPGTLSIGTEALAFTLLELGRSASAWARRILFVNGHGGNVEALRRAVPTLRSEDRDAAWLPCATPVPGDAHAGRTETSLLLHLAPAAVRADRVAPGNTAPLSELLPRMREVGVRGVSPDGVLGDPTGAAADEGDAWFRGMCDLAWTRLAGWTPDPHGMLARPVEEDA